MRCQGLWKPVTPVTGKSPHLGLSHDADQPLQLRSEVPSSVLCLLSGYLIAQISNNKDYLVLLSCASTPQAQIPLYAFHFSFKAVTIEQVKACPLLVREEDPENTLAQGW